MEASLSRIAQVADSIIAEGFEDIVFLAISSSSLAAELVSRLSLPTLGARFHVLNRLDSSGIRKLENSLDLKRTLFLVASKSGKNLETHALLLYFLEKTKCAGMVSPGRNFIAITEKGSYLESVARQNRFREVLLDPAGFRGRYSGVVHFGLLLAGLCRVNPDVVLGSAREMQDRCSPRNANGDNPALPLAAFLSVIAEEGFHRLVFLTHPDLVPLAKRLSHLIGTSTCKAGRGIVPFSEAAIPAQEILEKHCSVCFIRFAGEESSTFDQLRVSLSQSGVPMVSVELGGIGDIVGEVLKWEIATCLACALMNVNPFDEPDFGGGRDAAIGFVDRISRNQEIQSAGPRLEEGNLSLFAEGELRHEISSLNLEQALSSFFSLLDGDGYLAILCFAWNLPIVKTCMTALAERLGSQLRVPAQLVYGPRYLHLLGQCYKGGPRSGLFLMITSDPLERIEVPGAGYSFGDLVHALALGDFDAMVRRNRPVVRIHLHGNPETALAELESVMERALKVAHRLS